jgi:hypothetical protein
MIARIKNLMLLLNQAIRAVRRNQSLVSCSPMTVPVGAGADPSYQEGCAYGVVRYQLR